MSSCVNLTKNGDNASSIEYLRNTSNVLRRNLQCWISALLSSGWMPQEPISETITDSGLFYPLGIVRVDFQGIQPPSPRFELTFL